MSSVRPDSLQVEETLGDGNCALNALALALSQQECVIGIEARLKQESPAIDPNSAFKDLMEHFHQQNWEQLKVYLFQLKQKNKLAYQKQMAIFLRKKVLQLAENNVEYRKQAKAHFLGAYDAYALSKQTGRKNQDDIYSVIPEIEAEFKKIYEAALQTKKNHALGADEQERRIKQSLANYFEQKAYASFMAHIKKEGSWLGANELALLARYFYVNLNIHHLGNAFEAVTCHGLLSTADGLTQQQLQQLVSRGVVLRSDRDGPGAYSIVALKPDILANRLDRLAATDYQTAYEKITKIVQAGASKDIAAGEFSQQGLAELIARNLVTANGKRMIVDPAKDDLQEKLSRLDAITEKEKVQAAYQRQLRSAATVSLQNKSAVHWSNMVPATAKNQSRNTNKMAAKQVEEQSKNVRFSVKDQAWKEAIDLAKKDTSSTIDPKNQIHYDFSLFKKDQSAKMELERDLGLKDKNNLNVSKATQEKLDYELAKLLQAEENRKVRSSNRS